jgi:predicted ATP-grasp superfamily ATP-dependent carboligase
MLFRVDTQPGHAPASAPLCAAPVRVGSRTSEFDVLLLDAEHRQTLAAMRALSRAGLRVGALACESAAWWAPALKSRFCAFGGKLPDLDVDAESYATAVLRLLDEHPARMLLPAYDGSIQALRSRRAEIERRTALPLASESALDVAVSKIRTLEVARDLGLAVPHGVPLCSAADVPAAIREVGLPAVVKPYESWVERDGQGARLSPNVVQTLDEARQVYDHVVAEGGQALMQPWLPGRREAVTLFFAEGHFWARVAQVSYREWPVLGGASVLCESIPPLRDIVEPAERLVRAIDLEGCAMVEFRRDRDGRPVLMEVNPRMGGSVALAIAAGVNFPALLYDWKVNRTLTSVSDYRVGKRLHWLAGDVWNLKCTFEMQGHPDVASRRQAVAAFVRDFLRPNNMLDGIELGDIQPTLAELDKMLVRHGAGRVRKLLSNNHSLSSERAR